MVDGGARPRGGGALRVLLEREAPGAGGAAGAVRGLRVLAARVALGRGAGAGAGPLAARARGGAAAARAADRPAAAGGEDGGGGALHGRPAGGAVPGREGATLFMTLLAAFEALLSRYSGQEDVCVGMPIANRTRAETEGLIGFFVNTLVVRGDLTGHRSFGELVGRVREKALSAYAHQDVPFEKVVDALQPERSLGYTPLFQVMFSLQDEPPPLPAFPGVAATQLDLDAGTSKFDLSLIFTQRPEGLRGAIEYSRDLFDEGTVARMAGHLETLLSGAAADPERRISELPLMREEERRRVVVEWNRTDAPLPAEPTFHQMFEGWAARTPEAVAVAFEDERVTYGELDRRANKLAHHLRRLGAGPGSLVGICAERSPAMVTAVLAVMKAGGAYLPLDPAYPTDRLAFMLADSGVGVLLTQAHLVEKLPVHLAHTVRLHPHFESIALEPGEALPPLAGGESLAYVIYTSGSTGKPKGALLRHRGLCNLAQAHRRAFDVGPGRRVLQFAPFSFDASVWEIAVALGSGATLWLARQETLSGGAGLTP